MLLVLTAAAILVVAGVALLIVGDRPLLADDPVQRPSSWPPDGAIGAQDVRRARFEVVVRGYRMEQVDRVLADTSAALSERDVEIARLKLEIAVQRAATEAQGSADRAPDGE